MEEYLGKRKKSQGDAPSIKISHTKVGHLLEELGYSLQSTTKTKQGSSNPDRNAQFEYINEQVKEFQKKEQPEVSVDTKKKELIFVGTASSRDRNRQPHTLSQQDAVLQKRMGKRVRNCDHEHLIPLDGEIEERATAEKVFRMGS